MITITERSREKAFIKLYSEHGVDISFITYGNGTATSAVLNTFGLEASEKAIMGSFVTSENFVSIKKDLQRRFHIDIPGTGVVFLIPLSSIGGKKQLSILLGSQEYVRGEESVMKNTETELIVVIANNGHTETIMDAARSAGVRGGTIIHAKGTGAQGTDKFMGMVIAEKKEMLYMVVNSADRDKVMRAIMDSSGLRTEAQAVVFSLPVSATAGMRLAADNDD
jgi:nitrogen regulatory protein PII